MGNSVFYFGEDVAGCDGPIYITETRLMWFERWHELPWQQKTESELNPTHLPHSLGLQGLSV